MDAMITALTTAVDIAGLSTAQITLLSGAIVLPLGWTVYKIFRRVVKMLG